MGRTGAAKAATSAPSPTWAHYFFWPHLEQTHVDEQTGEEGVGVEGG